MTWYEILAIVIVGLFILSGPFLFYIFGKEDGCGRTIWSKWISKKKQNETK